MSSGEKNISGIKLPQLMSDGMVLQRNKVNTIWGWATIGEAISLEFNGDRYETTTAADGKWSIDLPELEAGGPYRMVVAGHESSVVVDHILVGDVWICSGQSNMVLPMGRVNDLYAEEIANSNDAHIRLFTVPDTVAFTKPREDIDSGQWIDATREHILDFTAVGYFFAKTLHDRYGVPIGLINSSVGGSPVQAWMSEEALATSDPEQLDELGQLREDGYIEQVKSKEERAISGWFEHLNEADQGLAKGQPQWFEEEIDTSDWETMNIPAFWDEQGIQGAPGVVWFRKQFDVPASLVDKPARLLLGTIIDSDTAYVNGRVVGTTGYQYPPRKYSIPAGVLKEGKNTVVVRVVSNADKGGFTQDKPYQVEIGNEIIDLIGAWHYKVGADAEGPMPSQTFFTNKPLGLYNGMIAPLLQTAIKGVIWYQGESNSGEPQGYEQLFKTMINDWRAKWKQGSLGDFPFLFVQLANFMPSDEQPSESGWAALRHEQFKTLSLPNTGMAVAIDVGEWNDLHPLNKRDVGVRLALAAQHIAYGDTQAVPSGPLYDGMQVVDGKITIDFKHVGSGLVAKGNEASGALQHFAIAGADQQFVWANAVIAGDQVVVWHDDISDPIAVRYAWANNPQSANLYNKEGLPASPFTTESL